MFLVRVEGLIVLLLSSQLLLAGPSSGYVVAWGVNLTPQGTGVPAPDYFSTNLVVAGGLVLSNAVQVAGGMAHGLAQMSDGTVSGWGDDYFGEAIGFKSAYPYNTNGFVKIGDQLMNEIIAVSAGRTHSLALKRDGIIIVWGDNEFGQTNMPPGLSNVVAISVGGNHNLALKQNGTVVGWGEGNKPPLGLSNIVAIAASRGIAGHDLALKSNGTIVEWNRRGIPGEFPAPHGLGQVVAIATGTGHNLALRRDGTVFGWGTDNYGQATGVPTEQDLSKSPYDYGGPVMIAGQVLTNVVAIAAGDDYSLALKKDGTVVSWGHPFSMKMTVPPGLKDVVAIAAGDNFCLAITTNSDFTVKVK